MGNLIPIFLSAATFTAGLILLFSGAVSVDSERLRWMRAVLPLPIVELSHFLGSIIGVFLLFLARSLYQRIDAAYVLTLCFLGAGALLSVLKGWYLEQAIVLALMFTALLPARKLFYRKSSIIAERLTTEWTFLILLAVTCSVGVGVFSYRDIRYTDDLWWKFEVSAEVSRFLRATLGVAFFLFFLAVLKLLGPASPRFVKPLPEQFEKVRRILSRHPRSTAQLAFSGDKMFLLSDKENCFLMYRVRKRSWIVLDDPVGPPEEWKPLVLGFRHFLDRYNGWPVFWGIGRENLPLYLDSGLSLLKIGEEARVPLGSFSAEQDIYRELAHDQKKINERGFSFEVLSKDLTLSVLPDLKRVSDQWLRSKSTREKGFSLGFFSKDYLENFRIAVVRDSSRIVAFANILETADHGEFSGDLIRYDPQSSPKGVMDYLFMGLLLWGQREGYHSFVMGTAPLSGLGDNEYAPLWYRLGYFVYSHGEDFYNFQGLRRYKEKFHPVWEPKYLACPGGLALPQILTDLSAVVSGGLRGIIAK